MSKPTNKEILDSIQRTYILSEALNSELIWLKSYCKPEYVKIINEAKAKVNHLKVTIASDTSKEALAEYEEIAFTFHEKVMEVINPKPSIPNNSIDYSKSICDNCGTSAVCDYYGDSVLCQDCIPKE